MQSDILTDDCYNLERKMSESDIERAIANLNRYPRKVGGLDQQEDSREMNQMHARMKPFFLQILREYNCRFQISQISGNFAWIFRRKCFMEENRLFPELKDSNSMQLDVISTRPVTAYLESDCKEDSLCCS